MKNIENIGNYVKCGIENGDLCPNEVYKFARIHAVQGVEGQEVVTQMQNGLVETRNVVTLDEKTGNPGWIVTNPSGEQYIVEDSKFAKKYEIDPQNPEVYKPKGGPVTVVRLSEDISFKAPWGEDMTIKSGGYLVLSGKNDIYGIQEAEFNETYKPTDRGDVEVLQNALDMMESDKSIIEILSNVCNNTICKDSSDIADSIFNDQNIQKGTDAMNDRININDIPNNINDSKFNNDECL